MGIFKYDDGIYKHIEQTHSSSNVTPTPALARIPIPEGGYTNEFLYNKICSIETKLTAHISPRFDKLLQELLVTIANSNQTHYENEEEMEENDNELTFVLLVLVSYYRIFPRSIVLIHLNFYLFRFHIRCIII